MYTDEIKVFAKNENDLKNVLRRITNSQDIGKEFCIEKCAMLIMKSRKRKTAERIEMQIKKAFQRKEKNKNKRTWEYWNWTPSNKWK